MNNNIYRSRHTGLAIDKGVSSALLRADLSAEEYRALKASGHLQGNVLYCIFRDVAKTVLSEMYIGATLIGPADLSGYQQYAELTQAEYDALKASGRVLPTCLYRIYADQGRTDTSAVYLGLARIFSLRGDSGAEITDLTQTEYDRLKAAGTVKSGTIYRIYGDSSRKYLMAVYDGTTLVARRGTSGNNHFPYTFPITF